MTRAPLDMPCHACAAAMGYAQEIADPTGMAKGVIMHVYQCSAPTCGRKAVVIYEPAGELTPEAKTFIEREVMRAGSFFPQDLLGGRFGDRSRFGRS